MNISGISLFYIVVSSRESHMPLLIISLNYFSSHYAVLHSLKLVLFWFFLLMFLHSFNTYLLSYWFMLTTLLDFFPQLMPFIAYHRVALAAFVEWIHTEMYFSFSHIGRHWPSTLQQVVCIILSELFSSLFSYFSFDWKIVNDIE